MKILVAYYSKTGSTEKVALALKGALEKGHEVTLAKIKPVKDLKAYQYKKNGGEVGLEKPVENLKPFDLVFIGTPVWNFSPTPIILSYLRRLENPGGKKFALFATCTALPGTTIQKMGSILSTQGGKVLETHTIRSVFEISREKLLQAKRFAEEAEKKAKK